MGNYIPPNIFVVYINSSDVTISGLTIKNGICISGTGDRLTITGTRGGISLIGNNQTVTNNISGISITGSSCLVDRNRGHVSVIGSNNVVSNNNVGGTVSLGGGMGIEVTGDSNTIVNNTVTNCQIGVMLYCNNSLIADNCIEGNYFMGLCLFQANNNIIHNNYIAYNLGRYDGWGISLSGNPHMHYATNNRIYNNAILGNNHTFRVDPPISQNFWDNSKAGNYWGDYNGSDTNGDGTGDSSYIMNEINVDHYPLMSPPSISIPIAQGPFYIPPDVGEPYPIISTATPSPILMAKEGNGSAFVLLATSGNVTASQMSNATLARDQSTNTITISFNLAGESSTTGFSNLTIPKSAVFNGTTPKIFIDNQLAQDQGYTQDENYFFVWYTTHFSTHQISIIFSASQNSDSSSLPIYLIWIGAGSVSIVIAMVIFVLLVYFNKHNRKAV